MKRVRIHLFSIGERGGGNSAFNKNRTQMMQIKQMNADREGDFNPRHLRSEYLFGSGLSRLGIIPDNH